MFLQLRIRGGGIFYVYFLISYILNNLACKQIFGIFLVTDIEPSRFFIHIFEEIWTGWRTSLKVWLPEKNTFWFFWSFNASKEENWEPLKSQDLCHKSFDVTSFFALVLFPIQNNFSSPVNPHSTFVRINWNTDRSYVQSLVNSRPLIKARLGFSFFRKFFVRSLKKNWI